MPWFTGRNNMKGGKHMKENRRVFFMACCWLLSVLMAYGQDPLPERAKTDSHSAPVYLSEEMEKLMRFLPVSDSMPEAFSGVQENCITDPTASLASFWQKLSRLDKPVRIVHIGDSHVRSHIFPAVVRKLLEEDFGSDAVDNIPLTYQTSGIASETGKPGIVYHVIGINGATCSKFLTPKLLDEIEELHPDMVILSFGTNEAHGRLYNEAKHTSDMNALLSSLKARCPESAFLLTTPPGAYMRLSRSRRVVNTRTPLVVENELKFVREHALAVWDLYDIVGGSRHACLNWTAANMYQRDKIHFTREGYTLQGLLLHEALIKAYNDYVAIRLE